MAKPLTVKDILAKKKPLERKFTLVLDGEIADQFNAAQEAVKEARAAFERLGSEDNQDALADAVEHLEELRPQMEAASIEVKMRAIGRKAYEDLQAEYPATEEQRKRGKKEGYRPSVDLEQFPRALVAASLTEPVMTLDEVNEMWDSENFNDFELGQFYGAAVEINTLSKVVDLKKD